MADIEGNIQINDPIENQGIEQIRENTIILAVTWNNVINLYSMKIYKKQKND